MFRCPGPMAADMVGGGEVSIYFLVIGIVFRPELKYLFISRPPPPTGDDFVPTIVLRSYYDRGTIGYDRGTIEYDRGTIVLRSYF